MSIEVVPLDFLGQGALIEPKHPKLHDAAVDYCLRELAGGKDVDFSKFAKVWVGLKDEEVFGVCGYVLRPDVPLFRATDATVLRALAMRMNNFFADSGVRGQEAFIYIGDEKPSQRCPEWKTVLKEFSATSAKRFSIEVK
jgi:hypothetical protein